MDAILLWWGIGFWCGVFATAVMIRKFTARAQEAGDGTSQ